MSFEEIQKRAEAAGQGHLFKEWPNLSPQEKDTLVADIQVHHLIPFSFRSTSFQRLDFEGLNATFQATMHSTGPPSSISSRVIIMTVCILEIEMEEEVLQPATDVLQLKA